MAVEPPEDEEEYEERRKELIEDAKETRERLDEKQDEALEQIAAGDDFERYETVTLGDLNIEVKAWMSGRTEQRFNNLTELDESDDIAESAGQFCEALAEMTPNSDFDVTFWQAFYDEWGQRGLITAFETIFDPALEDLEAKGEAIEGFRAE